MAPEAYTRRMGNYTLCNCNYILQGSEYINSVYVLSKCVYVHMHLSYMCIYIYVYIHYFEPPEYLEPLMYFLMATILYTLTSKPYQTAASQLAAPNKSLQIQPEGEAGCSHGCLGSFLRVSISRSRILWNSHISYLEPRIRAEKTFLG